MAAINLLIHKDQLFFSKISGRKYCERVVNVSVCVCA